MFRWLMMGVFWLAAPIMSGAATPAPARGNDPKGAVLRFFDAVLSGDQSRIEQSVRSPTGDTHLLVRLLASPAKLEAAAIARFGESGKQFNTGYGMIIPADASKVSALAMQIVPETDRRVRVYINHRPGATIVHLDSDGQWRVQIFGSEYDETGDDQLRAILEAQETVISAIGAGKYKDVGAAEADLLSRLEAIQDRFLMLAR